MQAIMETLFDSVYLISVITVGILMIRGSKGNGQFRLFGWMAVILGAGDSFHLVPRIFALCTTGLENYTALLGAGKLVTSITMTIFMCCCIKSGDGVITSTDRDGLQLWYMFWLLYGSCYV